MFANALDDPHVSSASPEQIQAYLGPERRTRRDWLAASSKSCRKWQCTKPAIVSANPHDGSPLAPTVPR